jgi:hypothetical protein
MERSQTLSISVGRRAARLGRSAGPAQERWRKLADEMLAYDDKALAAAMENKTIMEIDCHG